MPGLQRVCKSLCVVDTRWHRQALRPWFTYLSMHVLLESGHYAWTAAGVPPPAGIRASMAFPKLAKLPTFRMAYASPLDSGRAEFSLCLPFLLHIVFFLATTLVWHALTGSEARRVFLESNLCFKFVCLASCNNHSQYGQPHRL